MKKNFSGVKVKFAEEDHLNTKNYEPDGYDSDPEMYSSNIMNPKSPTKKIREKGETSKSFYADDLNIPSNLGRKDFKVTVPVPFKFDER